LDKRRIGSNSSKLIFLSYSGRKEGWGMIKHVKRFNFNAIFLLFFAGAANTTYCAEALLLYGGEDHDVYLGCLNCSSTDSNSVWNEIGQYGSSVSSTSIWNTVGQYGSSVSSLSPWNSISSEAPAIVDRNGGFYGYFSSNTVLINRTRIDWLVWILDNHDYVVTNFNSVVNQLGF